MHPADEIRGSTSQKLANKTIILGITGSIAAVETVALARELIRHGANVLPVMTESATRIIHPDAVEFATAHKPIIGLSGRTEHVTYCGLTKNAADLLLISPCTGNTVSKIAHAVDDSPVTTFATTAFGSGIPIILVPAMHLSMYDHRIFQQNIKKLKQQGVTVLEPIVRGNKARMPSMVSIVAQVLRTLGSKDMKNIHVLVIGGGTEEPIDDIRVLTNTSSGRTAVACAVNAFERGATVEVWYGSAQVPVPAYIPIKRFSTIHDLQVLVRQEHIQRFDVIILCAALADYIPRTVKGKIKSGKTPLVLTFDPAEKVLPIIRKKASKAKIIAFKAEASKATIINHSRQLLNRYTLDLVIGNTVKGFGSETNEIAFVTKKGKSSWKKGSKEKLAAAILDTII